MRPSVVVASVAGVVAVLVAVAGLLPGPGPVWDRPVPAAAASPVTTQPEQSAGLPRSTAGYSYLTGSVSASPPGRAVALWQQGLGVELMDLPQAIVLSADGDSYRRVDLAERRGGAETQGDPAPMLLSPDGRQVAVGHHASRAADLALLDLSTGDVERVAVPGAASVLPVAWSPDGRQVAYLASDDATDPHSGRALEGRPGVADLGTGEARSWPGAATATTLAFSPDGRELAVQWARGAGAATQVRSVDGTGGRDVVVPRQGRLAGPHAWSPDGGLLTVSGPDGALEFLDATGSGVDVPDTIGPEAGLGEQVLGWVSAREVVLPAAHRSQGTGPGDFRVLRVDLDDQRQQVLTTVPTRAGYGVVRFQLAGALLPDLQVRAAGDPDRGVWPFWLQGAVAALLVGLVGALGRTRRGGRRGPSYAGEPGLVRASGPRVVRRRGLAQP